MTSIGSSDVSRRFRRLRPNTGSLGLFVAHPRTYADLLADARDDCLLEKERSVLGIDH